MAESRVSATALLVAVACLVIAARIDAAPVSVPSNTMPVASGSYAKWNTLYPNSQVCLRACCVACQNSDQASQHLNRLSSFT
jgi:hypothetical protein